MPSERHQVEVLGPAVVVVAGHVTVVVVVDRAGTVGERVPDAGAASVLGDGALDLVRRGGDAPDEPFGERRDVEASGVVVIP